MNYNSKAEKVSSASDFGSLVIKLYLDEKNILLLRENYEEENSNVTFKENVYIHSLESYCCLKVNKKNVWSRLPTFILLLQNGTFSFERILLLQCSAPRSAQFSIYRLT